MNTVFHSTQCPNLKVAYNACTVAHRRSIGLTVTPALRIWVKLIATAFHINMPSQCFNGELTVSRGHRAEAFTYNTAQIDFGRSFSALILWDLIINQDSRGGKQILDRRGMPPSQHHHHNTVSRDRGRILLPNSSK